MERLRDVIILKKRETGNDDSRSLCGKVLAVPGWILILGGRKTYLARATLYGASTRKQRVKVENRKTHLWGVQFTSLILFFFWLDLFAWLKICVCFGTSNLLLRDLQEIILNLSV